jgi:Tol biopolymer transport system component
VVVPPTTQPTEQPPTALPTAQPAAQPTLAPTAAPTQQPSPTPQPAASQRVLFIRSQLQGQSELWSAALDGSDARNIIACPNGCSMQLFVPSPDGSQIAYLAQPPGELPEIRVVRADGSDDRSLDKSGMLAPGAFSPDGTQLAFLRSRQADTPIGSENSIWIVPTAGGEPRQISPWYALIAAPAWADTEHVVYDASESFSAAGQVYRIALQASAEPEVLTRGSLAALSPDGTKLLVALESSDDIAPDTRFAHAVVALAEPSRTLATLSLRPGQYVWSPDSSRLALYSSYGHVAIVDTSSGQETLLRDAPLGKAEPYMTTIAWSGDGGSVIYGGQGSGPKPAFELRRLEVDGSGEQLLQRLPVGSGSDFALVP